MKVGIYFSSVSAAMSNLIGASRILYALSKDNLFGGFCDFNEPAAAMLWLSLSLDFFLLFFFYCTKNDGSVLLFDFIDGVLALTRKTSNGGNPWASVLVSWMFAQVG